MNSINTTEKHQSGSNANALPEGWALTTLGEICEINPPKARKDSLSANATVSFVPMPAVDADEGAITAAQPRKFSEVCKGFTSFRDGDVIMAKITPCMENGKAAIARNLTNGLGFGSTEFHVLRPTGAVHPEFIYHLVRQESYRRAAEAHMTGSVGQKRVPQRFLETTELPLPPLHEQSRIVQNLGHQLKLTAMSNKRLGRVQTLLRRFRQAVLDAATSGRLTQQWRTENLHDAHRDLELILKQRHRQNQHAEADPTEGHELLHEALPHGWATPSVGDIFRFIDYRGKSPKKSDAGKRLITAKNVERGYLSDEPVEYVSEKTYVEWMTRGFPRKGDILFVTEGHTMGFAALNDRGDDFALAQRVITLQPWYPIETRCFLFFLMSSLFQGLVKLNATGSAAVGIKGARLRGLPIPFPSIAEQREIVRQVDALFELSSHLENSCGKGQSRVERLTQSILAKAFRGELVPTEAELARREGREYESASVLLERIRAERASQEKSPTASKRKLRRASAHV